MGGLQIQILPPKEIDDFFLQIFNRSITKETLSTKIEFDMLKWKKITQRSKLSADVACSHNIFSCSHDKKLR